MYKKLGFLILSFIVSGCANVGDNKYVDMPEKEEKTQKNQGDIKFSSLSELSYTTSSFVYKIQPYDLIEIKVFQAEELSQDVQVNPSGYISLPLINKIRAAGLSQEQLQASIVAALKKDFIQDPQVSVFIKEYTNQRVTVSGDVKQPGVYPIVGDITLLQAIAQAGGLDELANPTEVILFRLASTKQVKAYQLNLKEINKGLQKDPYLQPEDKVIVQRSGARQWLKDIRMNIPFIGAAR
jgi:polysaccharide export outer membrane protein